ncbi:DUF5011 domain-containing protein [Muricauda sp. JGD-17]|uniref:DUF5011 domain-containing protein n=2 Tax=Flagellimonas ochracea TaxID=2696472 RepID=A0A964TCK1_9FLAO|nr:DUF5011 domain-containing protein [Allomuricauda ochracea]
METGGGQFQNVQFPLGTAVDFSGDNKTIQLELFASTAIDVLVKFEDGAAGARDVEVLTTHTGSGWETLSFDFATDGVASFIQDDPQNGQALVPDGQYSGIILFIGFSADPGVEGTFLVDNIIQTTAEPAPSGCTDELIAATALPVDFEGCETFLSSENFGDGITSELVENPFKTGINTSDFVLQIDKPTGSSFFAGVQNTFESNFDLTTTDVFSLKVYSTKANVVFRFELALNPQTVPPTGNPTPVFVTIPNANEWTEVEFTFTGLPGGPMAYNQLVIKPDNPDGITDPVAEGGTYYIDDLSLGTSGGGGGGGASLDDCGGDLVNDFETDTDAIFANFGGGVGTIIDNPDTSVNTSAKVGQYVKNAGADFAGITIEVDPDIAFDSGVFSIDVYSEAVRQLLFKLEGLNIEVIVPTSGTGWETITYDFSPVGGNVGTVTAITLIMDNGTVGDGSADWTIQFDNIRLCSNGSSGGGDTTPPVITLNGDAVVNVNVGDSFVDPGATATDDTDGPITGDIVVGGDTVDTNTIDTYIITYNVSDAAGNAAAEVTRTVNVVDPSMPFSAAPTPPARDPGDVISLFSNAYTDITVDTFYAAFSVGGGVSDVQVAGNDTKLYTDLDFAGVETLSASVDLSSMTMFHIDVWSQNSVDFLTRVVDFAGDGFGGGNDTQGDETTNLSAGSWTSIDVSIADFQTGGFTATPTDFSQLILDVVGVTGTVYVDNIYFYNDSGGGGGGGLTPLSSLPADFESGEEFGGVFEPASVNGSIIANPVSGGINTSANVYEFNKPVGTEFYGGMENVFASPLDLTTTRTFKVKIYSSKPNVVVQFELQSRPTDPGIPNYSIQQTVTNANEWVELTFDFGAIVPGTFNPNIYNAIVIIPDFDTGNNPTSSSETYYIDDVVLE